MQQLLPLAHHAHILVVQNEDLHRQVMLDSAGHFLDAHLDRRITGNIDNKRIRMCNLNAERCRQAVSHRAETA
ncbi:hypothetical protein D3C73_465780 [compost metagenome]